jgi:hypothetical protein
MNIWLLVFYMICGLAIDAKCQYDTHRSYSDTTNARLAKHHEYAGKEVIE